MTIFKMNVGAVGWGLWNGFNWLTIGTSGRPVWTH